MELTHTLIKQELLQGICRYMPKSHINRLLVDRTGLSRQHVYNYFRSDLHNAVIQEAAMQLLKELKQQHQAQLKAIKNP
jgi:hypothetical protein